MENKQEILDLMLPALQATDNLDDLVSLVYYSENELVRAGFANGSSRLANVAMDSGTSMIRDVVKQIL